jgi:hypothetical protein
MQSDGGREVQTGQENGREEEGLSIGGDSSGEVDMGAIVDILLLDELSITLLKSHYPACVLKNQSNTSDRYQQYRVIIPDVDQYDDSYYDFLFDNLIASSSRNFMSRFEHDESFKSRIRARADANPARAKSSATG